ncbi:MAG: hypothetical protein M0D55_08945 [Elusimicrobiota bacterium]|nr:MAG: hypothetical protein M0D55_08945 [Elusimicrobiota bacterium]
MPEAFTPLLAGKTARLTKAKQRCVDRSAAVGGQLDGIMQLFRTLEPPSPNMKTQRASVVELNKRLIAAVERENPRAGAKKAAAPKDAEAGQ